MKKLLTVSLIACLLMVPIACKVSYSFTGADTGDAQTFQVNNFINNAPIVEPRIARELTIELQELILNQTNLSLTDAGGDLIYEGEITQYYVSPITATAQSTAAQNRLTMAVNVRFINIKDPTKDFEQRFSFYYDYEGGAQLVGSQLDEALEAIYERITQDIFNASLANW